MEIRNFRKDDVPLILDFYKMEDMLPADSYKVHPFSTDEFNRMILEVGPFGETFDSKGFFLAFEGGTLVGVARALVNTQFVEALKEKVGSIAPEWPWSPIGLSVHPSYRRKGIGSMLLNKCMEYLRVQGMEWAHTSTDKNCISRRNFLLKHGFKVWGYRYTFMQRDLSEPIPRPILPKGYAFKEFTIGQEEELIECSNEIFKDEWLYRPRSVTGFVNYYEKHPDFDPSGLFSIVYKGEFVGFVWNLTQSQYSSYLGSKTAILEVLGVRKEHRRKGLGTALTLNSLIWLREKGMDYCDLGTHSIAALDMYKKCGFKIRSEWILLRRQI